MQLELALVLSVALGAAPAPAAQGDPPRAKIDFAVAVSERAAGDVRAWSAAHEGEVFGRTRSIAVALLAARAAGDAAGAEASRSDLAFVAGALDEAEPAARLAGDVLAWTPGDFEACDALQREVEAARALLERGDADSAWLCVERVLAAAQPPGAPALLNKPLSDLAKLAAGLVSVERVRELVDALLARAEAARDAPWIAWYAEWLGQIEWAAGGLEGASRSLERAIEARRALGHADSEAAIRANLALVRLSLGDLEGGLANAIRAAELARSLGDRALARTAAHARAMSLFDLGELEAALALLTEVDAQGRERDAVQLRLDILHAGLLQDVGRLESARTWAERALELAGDENVLAEAPNLPGEALLSAGLLFGDLREFDRALATLDEAQRFFERVGDARGVAWTRKNRGWVLLDRGSPAEAQAEFDRALAYERAEGKLERSPFLEGWCELGRAESASRLDPEGEKVEIEAWLRVAETCAQRLHDLYLAARVWTLRGTRRAARGDDPGALSSFETAVRQIEQLRVRFSQPGLLTHFLRDKVDPYRQAALAAARLGDGESALRVAESARARALFEQRARSELTADSTAGERVEAARRALAQAESMLRAEGGFPARSSDVTDAERELDTALLDAELAAPCAARLRGSPWPLLDLDRIAERLRGGPYDTLVEYVLAEPRSLAIVLSPRETELRIDVAFLPAGEREIAELVERLRGPIEALARGELDLAHVGFDVAAARAAHAALIAPLASRLGERVAIVPDGCLWTAPFECFVTGGETGPVDPGRPFAHLRGLRFLIEERTIGFLPAAAVLCAPPRSSEARGVVAVLPPAADGPSSAAGEVDALRAALEDRLGELRVCSGVDLAAIEREARSARWLDFIAHGRFDARFPASSHLALGENGRLAAWEIERWRIGARLAVLSACHGGEGPLAAGEGALGLARSFLVAGAEEVVASLWAVEDRATCELMRALWSEIGRGVEVLDALRRAKLGLIATDDPRGFARAHPYFWAGWISLRGE